MIGFVPPEESDLGEIELKKTRKNENEELRGRDFT